MLSKKTIKEIVNTAIYYGHDEDTRFLYIAADNSWGFTNEKPKTDIFYFEIPSYEDEPFVEDKKTAFMLDLMQAYNEWVRTKPQREGGRKAAKILLQKDPDYFKKLRAKRTKK